MKILLAGGGTGGHVFPALAVAQRALAQDAHNQVLFVGNPLGLEAKLVPGHGFPFAAVKCSGFAARSWRKKLISMQELWHALWHARRIIRDFAPDVVVGFGGYVSMPVTLAALLSRVPVVLHEQNAAAGLANRVAARWARRICVSMPQAGATFPAAKVRLTGNPVRAQLFSVPPWRGEVPTLLVFGGSQGADALNACMPEAVEILLQEFPDLQVLHQSGTQQRNAVEQAYAHHGGGAQVEVVEFIDDMREAYSRSALVICRAGATTVAELAASGRPAIMVPFPQAAGDHQTLNAMALVQAGAAGIVAQHELTPQRMADEIRRLLQNPAELFMMAQRARRAASKGAADLILHQCRLAARKR